MTVFRFLTTNSQPEGLSAQPSKFSSQRLCEQESTDGHWGIRSRSRASVLRACSRGGNCTRSVLQPQPLNHPFLSVGVGSFSGKRVSWWSWEQWSFIAREDSLVPANTAQPWQASIGRMLPCSTLGRCIGEHLPWGGRKPGCCYYQLGISTALGKAGAHRWQTQ